MNIAVSLLPEGLTLSLSDAEMITDGSALRITAGDLPPYGTVCVHGHLRCSLPQSSGKKIILPF